MAKFKGIFNPTTVPIEDFLMDGEFYSVPDNRITDFPLEVADKLLAEFPQLVGQLEFDDGKTEESIEEKMAKKVIEQIEPSDLMKELGVESLIDTNIDDTIDPAKFKTKDAFENALKANERYDCSMCATNGVQSSFKTHAGLNIHIGQKHK